MAIPAGRVEAAEYRDRRQWVPGYLLVAIWLIIGTISGAILGGPLAEFMATGAQMLPLAILALLTYLGVRRMWARVLAFVWLGVALLGLAVVVVLLTFGLLVIRSGALNTAPGGSPANLLPPGGLGQLGAATFWSFVGLVVAGLVLVPRVRRWLGHVLPIDAESSVHAIALSLIVGTTIISFGQLIAAGGRPPILEMIKVMPGMAAAASDTEELLRIVYGFAWMAPGAVLAAGFPTVRSFREAMQRLGLVRPTARQVIAGIGLAVLMAGGAWMLDSAIWQVWAAMGWPRTDSKAFDELLGAAISPVGAVLIGVTAGLGEEMAVRGALQPRLGILLSNLFFTSLHAFQYGFDALIVVFVVGLILGIVRARSNTTTSSIVHGVYNFVQVMVLALGVAS